MSATGEPNSKKARTEEIPDLVSGMTEDVKKAITAIDTIQTEIDMLNEKSSEEIMKIEQKYNQLRTGPYQKRTDLIKSINNFWVTTFINHSQLSTIIDEAEEAALAHLVNVEVQEFEDIKSGFKIRFTFSKNEYFENEVIEKIFNLGEESPSTETTPIQWKAGKSLIKEDKLNDQASDLSSANMTFFEWLASNLDPALDDIAELIKDDIWPNPLQYYLIPEDGDDEDGESSVVDEEDVLEEVDDDGSEGAEGDN